MENSTIRKRLWVSILVVCVGFVLVAVGLEFLTRVFGPQFEDISQMSWTGTEPYIIYQSANGVAHTMLMRADGTVLKTAPYFSAHFADPDATFIFTSEDYDPESKNRLEEVTAEGLREMILPETLTDIIHVSYSPDHKYLLVQGSGREAYESPELVHHLYLKNVEKDEWLNDFARQIPLEILQRTEKMTLEWVADSAHTLFIKSDEFLDSGHAAEVARFAYDADTQRLARIASAASVGRLKVNPHTYGQDTQIRVNGFLERGYAYELATDNIVVKETRPLIGLLTITTRPTYESTQETVLARWLHLPLYQPAHITHLLGESGKAVVEAREQVGILDLQTGQLARLMTVPVKGDFPLYSIQLAPFPVE